MDNELSYKFEFEVLFELPANCLPIYIPNSGEGVGRDGVMVKFSPLRGKKWMGIFAFGDMHPKGGIQVFLGPGKNA